MSKQPRKSFLSAFKRRGATSPPDETDDQLVEGSEVGHYVILEELGAGGMGVVFRAQDTKLDRVVALKFLPPHLTADPDATQRFLVEARAAARLDHPNICTIHEIGTLDDGRSFIAMAHYEGQTLTRLIDDRGRLPPEEAVGLATQVAVGLGRAHESDIIHRDIKPANLFLTNDDRLKILDFGIAKIAGVELTQAGAALGTVAYMSPEQVRGGSFDARTDIWSLGVLLYEMCSGERPFIGADHIAMMHGILELDPPPLDQMIPKFPAPLWKIVERCLQKDPHDRYENTAALIEALETCLAPTVTATDPGNVVQDDPAPSLAAEGERRQATVLSAHLAGRGSLEETLSPGEADRVLEECRDGMSAVIDEFGGVVNGNSGEALEALFGVPASQEDDAIRAVRAAVALCERVGALLEGAGGVEGAGLRCGVDTGRVVAHRDTTGRRAYRVAGDATELSARLAGQARVGEVVISDACRRTVGPFFEAESAGSLRDGDAMIETFRVSGETGVRSRIEAAAEAEDLTELAGREAELETLLQAGRSAGAGQGRFVSVVGDAGVGKSRLIYEFLQRIDSSQFDVIRGRCQSFGSDVPYLPFTDALRDRLDLSDVPGAESAQTIADRVNELSPDLASFAPFYLQLLSVTGVEEDESARLAGQETWAGDQHRVGLVESLSALFTLGVSDRPTIAILEDWHWVDTASRQVLQQLLEMVSAYPLLVVVTARPDGDLGWGTPTEHTAIVLGPLTPEDAGVIVRSCMAADVVPEALTRLLSDRTGGNPFFLEEVCRALSEEGTLKVDRGRVVITGSLDNLQLPDTVQGVIRTRLDRLDGDTRRLVRYASVIGREFGRDVLARALGDDTNVSEELDRLRNLGLIQQIRVVPTPTYRFRHALTQDVAYDGLLERQRAEIHGAVGEALETLRPDGLEQHFDRLAEHFAMAADWAKAVDYAVAATDRLWSFSEFGDAAEAQERALDWVNNLDDEESRFDRRIEMLLRQERLHEYIGDRARQQEIIDELLDSLDPEQHAEKIAVTYVRLGDLCILRREVEQAEQALDTALRITRETDDRSTQRHALRSLGLLRWHQQRHEEAVQLVENALELDREFENTEAVIGNLSNLGALYRSLGQYDRALEYLEEALAVERTQDRRSAGMVVKESYILHSIGVTHAALGDHERGREYLEQARARGEVGTAAFNVVQMHFHLNALARLNIEEGRVDEALDMYEEAVELCRRTSHIEGLTTSLRVRGDVLLNLGRQREALPDLQEAAELYEHLGDQPAEALMWRGISECREALEDEAGALEGWRRTAELAKSVSDSDLALEAAEGMGRLLRSQDPVAALEAYQKALELTLPGGDRAKIGGLRYSIGILRWQFGAYEDALGGFEQAHEDLSAGGDSLHAGLALNSIGRTLRDLGRFDEAIERLEASVALNEQNSEPLLVSHALSTIGDVLLDSEKPELAVERFMAALAIRKELDDLPGQGWVLCSLVEAQLASGAGDGAAYYLAEVEDVASQTGDRELQGRCVTLRAEVLALNGEA